MLIDRTHTRWIVASALILLVSIAFYVPYHFNALNGPSGASWTGLTYGIIGIFFIFIAGGIGLRKKVRTWRIGKAQTWMRAHIWLGALSFPMILFHCGFDFGPAWSLAWVMMWLFVVIMVSGVVGLILQNTLPRMLTNRVRSETVFEQIDYVVEQLRWEADWLVTGVAGPLPDEHYVQEMLAKQQADKEAEAAHKKAVAAAKKSKTKPPPPPHKELANPAKFPEWFSAQGIRDPKARKDAPVKLDGSEPLLDFYLKEIQPYLIGSGGRDLKSEITAASSFQRLRALCPPELHDSIVDLESIVREKRELRWQQSIHNWLHTWLLIHGPISWAMMLMSVIHAVAALYY